MEAQNVPTQDGNAVPDALANIERSPLTLLHLLIIVLCACGFAIDFIEIALGNALSAVFSAPPHNLSGGDLSWLLTSVFIGAIIGAPVAGWIADRLGPRRVLTWTVLWLALASLGAALSPTHGLLTAARLLSGVALGAYPPLMMAYLADILPARRRAAAVFAVCALAYLAPPVALFALRALTPIHPMGFEGWRWLFFGAAVLCFLFGALLLLVPEAPHWLASQRRHNAVVAVAARFARSQRAFETGGREAVSQWQPAGRAVGPASARQQMLTTRFIVLCLVYFLIPWATAAFPLITGPILLARHFNLSDTLFYVGLATVGPALGTLIGGTFVDRIGRRTLMVACALVMLLTVIVFFQDLGMVPTSVCLIAFGIGTALYIPAMTLMAAEMFGPSVRGRTSATAWAVNRVGAAISPAVLLPLVQAGRPDIVAWVLGAALVANIAAVVTIGLTDTCKDAVPAVA